MMRLKDLLDQTYALMAPVVAAEELRTPYLVLATGDQLEVVVLDVGPGPAIARAAKIIVAQKRPEAAVLAMEVWVASPVKGTLEYAQLTSGQIAPSDAPPAIRHDELHLIGESALGEMETRQFILDSTTMPRRLVAREPAPMAFTRFQPLYPPIRQGACHATN